MAMKSCDGNAHHSSIALLQERFRQLQRAKEKREEKELVRLLSGSQRNISPARMYESSFFNPEPNTYQQRSSSPPVHQSSMFLQPNLQKKNWDLRNPETSSIFANISSTSTAMHRGFNLEDSDVDTSLHLWTEVSLMVHSLYIYLYYYICYIDAISISITIYFSFLVRLLLMCCLLWEKYEQCD